ERALTESRSRACKSAGKRGYAEAVRDAGCVQNQIRSCGQGENSHRSHSRQKSMNSLLHCASLLYRKIDDSVDSVYRLRIISTIFGRGKIQNLQYEGLHKSGDPWSGNWEKGKVSHQGVT